MDVQAMLKGTSACDMFSHYLGSAGGWFSIMMAIVFGGIMLPWFWGSSHKTAFFATHFNAHIKKLEDLLEATADSQDETAPYKLRLVADDKQVSLSTVTCCVCKLCFRSA